MTTKSYLLADTREGYRTLSHDHTVATGRRFAGPGTDYEVPTITVEEIGRLARSIGELPAYVFAAAVLTNGRTPLARDLISLGPWSWATDVWISTDAALILRDLDFMDIDIGQGYILAEYF